MRNVFHFTNKGFTLIEVLVVITIIGILAGVGAVSYSSVQKGARDTVRKSGVREIATAMEQYFASCGGLYPTRADGNFTLPISCGASVILPTVPYDPKTTPYQCSGCTGTAFSICANGMEASSPTGFCVRNRQ